MPTSLLRGRDVEHRDDQPGWEWTKCSSRIRDRVEGEVFSYVRRIVSFFKSLLGGGGEATRTENKVSQEMCYVR